MRKPQVAVPEILAVHSIEMCVKSALEMSKSLRIWGFKEFAYADVTTGRKYASSIAIAQGDIRIILTEALTPNPLATVNIFLDKHGAGVRDIALLVPNVKEAYSRAIMRGAIPIQPPKLAEDRYGHMMLAAVGTCGDVVHTLIEPINPDQYSGPFAPLFVASSGIPEVEDVGLVELDHSVFNEHQGRMKHWADHYRDVYSFQILVEFTTGVISSEYKSFQSMVVQSPNGKVTFPINEQGPEETESHVIEFLEENGGPGVQHMAFRTNDIIKTVRTLMARGVKFLPFPQAYYKDPTIGLRARFPDLTEGFVDLLAELGILFDRDADGDLLQIFGNPIVDRQTLFPEIIERRGSRGFGRGNFTALFRAKELEKIGRTKNAVPTIVID